MAQLESAINQQRDFIEQLLIDPLRQVAAICAQYWGKRTILDRMLYDYLGARGQVMCRLLYVIDRDGRQCSSNISEHMIDETTFGQDLSHRPYIEILSGERDQAFLLTGVYLDKQSHRPCITALHAISLGDEIVGHIAVDFDIRNLPLKSIDTGLPREWRQIKGDPSIRGGLFQQTRTHSKMDEHLDAVLKVIESLITEQGIFHAKLHFSSSRATLWSYDSPYHYRLHVLEEIIDPQVCLLYAKTAYPEEAVVPAERVAEILAAFKTLRQVDETVYLRAASINIINGLVGLNFSCDGSHYIPYQEFLDKDQGCWFG